MAPLPTKKQNARPPSGLYQSARTPPRSPIRKHLRITQGQKQALMDNLQLEITERARKLRAQYALQAQSLRARVELRVNRIPSSLRKAIIGELLSSYLESSRKDRDAIPVTASHEAASGKPLARKREVHGETTGKAALSTVPRGVKRTSDDLTGADKENAPDPAQFIPNPKKRTKTAVTASRQVTNPSSVLSPKSSNSRTLPPSPIRPVLGSGQNSYVSRPASPLKPFSPTKDAALAATAALGSFAGAKGKALKAMAGTNLKSAKSGTDSRPVAIHGKRAAAAVDTRTVSSSSNSSAMSSASMETTIVKKTVKQTAASSIGATKRQIGVSAAGKKITAAKADAPPTGRRVLRKRD